ncbi:MAG: helix-turn-helix domain-containing protein [Acidimicrobiales bacterium]|nr:helix-turn-helix domain-containing protein [Acidimicrobiales bacterium]
MHHHTISKHLEARAIPRRGGKPSFTEADLPALIEQYQAGDSCATIADRYGVNHATVMRWLKKAGIQMRPRRGGIRR